MTKFSTLVDPDIVKVSECPNASALTGAELIPLVQGGVNKKMTPNLLNKDQFNITHYGAVGGGVTDDSAALIAAIQAAYDNGGGEVLVPIGKYLINSQILIPNNATGTKYAQPSITIKGVVPRWEDGVYGLVNIGGSVLDMRYSGADAKVVTIGSGLLNLYDIALIDNGASTTPFVLTINTTLHAKNVTVEGNLTKSGATCDQDAFILGGTLAVAGHTTNNGFQGYGTIIEHCMFSRIRRGVFARTWANANMIRENSWDILCGSDNTAGAMEFDGSVEDCVGNIMIGNTIECTGYVYGIIFNYSGYNFGFGNSFYDQGVNFIEDFHTIGTTLKYSNVMLGTFSTDVSKFGVIGPTIINGGCHGYWQFFHNSIMLAQMEAQGGILYTDVVGGSHTTIDFESIVRSAGALNLYAGDAISQIACKRGLFKDRDLTTAARPAANNFDKGACYYDTTLSKPVWSDGTVWRDAAGTQV